MHFTTLVLAATAGLVAAQRPSNVSICDYYTTALLMNNTAANQYTVLTIVVNTVVIGNYSESKTNMTVPGILAPGTFNGTKVNLLPYFDGTLKSSNRGGASGVSVNFLDDGGAAPLMKNMPSAGNMTSNQFMLLTHLYEFFGVLLGCSEYGVGAFPKYGGTTSMGSVHKFMDLNPYEVGYFVQQVGLAAESLGVAPADAAAAGAALNKLFGYRCEPAAAILPASTPELQSICIDNSCPVAANATCAAYYNTTAPANTNGTTTIAPGSSGSTNASASAASGSASAKSPASHISASLSLLSLALGVIGFTVFLS